VVLPDKVNVSLPSALPDWLENESNAALLLFEMSKPCRGKLRNGNGYHQV